jgi:hypothetical protein
MQSLRMIPRTISVAPSVMYHGQAQPVLSPNVVESVYELLRYELSSTVFSIAVSSAH